MGRKKQVMPTESASVVAARNRQLLDLSKVDEEENRRVKQMRTVTRGVRAFRAVRGATKAGGSSAGPSAGSPGTDNYGAQVSLLNHYMSGGG